MLSVGLSVTFGGIRAVDGVTFEVGAGEIVGIIGPNGAGKTTMFDLISGFTPLQAGRIMLAGKDVTSLGAAGRARAGLGRSFQDARLFPELTVSETLAISLERFVESRSVFVAALHLPMVHDSETQCRPHGSTNCSSSWVSASTATRSSASCRPAPAGSSTSPAWSPTGRP